MKKLIAVVTSLMLLCGLTLPALAESRKDETVYVLAAPDGAANRIIVSDWLTNPDGLEELPDETLLENPQNVKGDGAFEGGVWKADGKDIYYQGDSRRDLPVQVKITYTLDGAEISADELAGKSGHVVIRFDYTVSASKTVKVQDKNVELTVPYVVLTGALLDNDTLTNIEVVNGRLVNDGDHTIVMGMALPGMQKNLDTDQVELPEYVQISADAEAFELPVTVTVATDEVFASLDETRLDSLDDLKASMTELTDGMSQLLDGGSQLYDGAGQLREGVAALSDGLTTLTANNDALVAGSAQVFQTLLDTANQQLAASGAQVPELTIETYADTLSGLIGSMTEEAIAQQARTQVEQAVRARESEVRQGVTQTVQAQVAPQVEAAVQETVLTRVLETLNLTPETYAAAKKAGQVTKDQQKQIEAAVEQQMKSDDVQAALQQQTQQQMESADVQKLIEENTESQIQALIEQNLSSKDVQKQIADNTQKYAETCARLTALKEQLDSYNTFYTGLVAYTQGVSSAAEGAAQLKDGAAQLVSGAGELKEGLDTFNQQGVDKLVRLVNQDADGLCARLRAMINLAREYNNYAGIADSMDGSVRFIWRTDAIQR